MVFEGSHIGLCLMKTRLSRVSVIRQDLGGLKG